MSATVSPLSKRQQYAARISTALFALLLAACGAQPPRPADERGTSPAAVSPAPTFKKPPVVTKRGGGFYKDDGPGDNPPENIDAIPDAVPRDEPLHRFANKPYSVLGQNYVPLAANTSYKAEGIASWYGRKFHGQKTSSGELYDMYGMTAAHPTLPIPSYVRVTNPRNGKSVVVRVNDRGPFHADRLIDLSWTAAYKLGYLAEGSTQVEVERLLPGQETTPVIAAATQPDPITRMATAQATGDPAPLPEVSRAGGHYVQLGAFANRDNAEVLRTHLARELCELGDKLVIEAAGSVFRVQLGPWPDALAARQAGDQVRESLGLGSIVVRR
jgi:rare lipoprotein A